MSLCRNCRTKLPHNARFCHDCGAKVILETFDCTECGTENPISAKYCSGCRYSFFEEKEEPLEVLELKEEPVIIEEKEAEKEAINDLFEKTPTSQLEKEIYDTFFIYLKQKIKEEQDIKNWELYLHRLEVSEFKIAFEIRTKHLAEDVQKLQEKYGTTHEKAQTPILKFYNDLSDFFLIHYCSDLNTVVLSEKILQYQTMNSSEVSLVQMCLDYLNFEEEEGTTYYTDFIEMPLDRLRVAGKSFLFPEKEEKIVLICDQSVTGSLKEGFAITEKGLYWKMHFEKPRKLLFDNFQEVVAEKDWIKINGQFFNADRSLNVKMMKLLRKINDLGL